MLRYIFPGMITVALWSTVSFGTELTGSYDGHNTPGALDGYTADGTGGAGPSYDVPANVGTTPSATFDDNASDGLLVANAGINATVEGGEFNGNFTSGIEAADGASINISGGVFDNNLDGYSSVLGEGSAVTITGGEFVNNSYAMDVNGGGKAVVTGGQFGDSKLADFIVIKETVETYSQNGTPPTTTVETSTLDLYGAFAGLTTGETEVLAPVVSAADGTFYGQLEDNLAPQTYTYIDAGGIITLHATGDLVPEPTSLSLLSLAGLGLLKRRR